MLNIRLFGRKSAPCIGHGSPGGDEARQTSDSQIRISIPSKHLIVLSCVIGQFKSSDGGKEEAYHGNIHSIKGDIDTWGRVIQAKIMITVQFEDSDTQIYETASIMIDEELLHDIAKQSVETKLHNSGQPGYGSCTVGTASGWRREIVCTWTEAAARTRSDVDFAFFSTSLSRRREIMWTRTEAAARTRSDVDFAFFSTALSRRREIMWNRTKTAAWTRLDVDFAFFSTALTSSVPPSQKKWC